MDGKIDLVKVLDALHKLLPSEQEANSSNAKNAVRRLLLDLIQFFRDGQFDEIETSEVTEQSPENNPEPCNDDKQEQEPIDSAPIDGQV